ncbi:hypothetical protein [Paeniglutamicibacter cryotolerans]|uniref:Uncharacterized protein n=1 Tax=Paeniglutamicibacter cryotolerans TaxID=670079 RepID=A0A839QKY7_9MICC|nr:hypothetical protein [Paeniglutamicibacter cryotolerans]MBB2996480.1 hypothetical protein [Paeniglutamicibacter cryotolerans]
MDTAQEDSEDAELKALLRIAFESQIPNFGSYNLVLATGTSGSSAPAVIGYRREPIEVVLAPLNPISLTPKSAAIEINITNLSHLALVNDGGYEIGTSTGRVFRFKVPASASLDLPDTGHRVLLDQDVDSLDFTEFMDLFMDTLDRAPRDMP